MIKTYVSRYVIPFYYEYENGGYNELVKYFLDPEKVNKVKKALKLPADCKWEKVGFWENYQSDGSTQAEMDTYTYLLELMREEERINADNLGVSYVLKSNGSLINLQYVKPEGNYISFKCTDLGTLLFRNGIGFIWYEIEFGKDISIEDYVSFQHDFKELARPHSELFSKKTGKDEYEIFCMGKWITNLFDVDSLGIRFWAERKIKEDNSIQPICIPDKSLLFQYMFIDAAEEQERMNLAFRVANGYDIKYNSPSTLNKEIYEPFGNSCFYTSKAGTAYVVSNNESNETFFKDNFAKKYARDYFFIYVLLLYQTYSCAHYSRLLTKLPTEITDIESNKMHINQIDNLHSQINLFLVKSTYESVSNIHHQNGAYTYGKRALRIEEDMRSLTAGLEALRAMEAERQKAADDELTARKDRALNMGLIIFGFLVVFSVTIDALNLVDWLNGNTMGLGHWVSLGVIGILTIFMIFVLIINICRKK